MCEPDGNADNPAIVEAWISAIGIEGDRVAIVVPHRSGKRCLIVECGSGTVLHQVEAGPLFSADEQYAACRSGDGFALAVSTTNDDAIAVGFFDDRAAQTVAIEVSARHGSRVGAMVGGLDGAVWLAWFESLNDDVASPPVGAEVWIGLICPRRGVVVAQHVGECSEVWIRDGAIAAAGEHCVLMWASRFDDLKSTVLFGAVARHGSTAAVMETDSFTLAHRAEVEFGGVQLLPDGAPAWCWIEGDDRLVSGSEVLLRPGVGAVESPLGRTKGISDATVARAGEDLLLMATSRIGNDDAFSDAAVIDEGSMLCRPEFVLRRPGGVWQPTDVPDVPAACRFVELVGEGTTPVILWQAAGGGVVHCSRWLGNAWGRSHELGSLADLGTDRHAFHVGRRSVVMVDRVDAQQPSVRIRAYPIVD